MFLPPLATARRVGLLALGALAIAGSASAQATSAGSAAARTAGQEDVSIADGGRDANGGQASLDGMIQTSPDLSTFGGSASALDTVAGVSAGAGSTAVGGNLNLVAAAEYAVVSPSDQPTTGAVGATPAH